ncbi:MAG: hypothetical protein V3U72_00690 [Candidatus Aenigmarchaeota archaeon]
MQKGKNSYMIELLGLGFFRSSLVTDVYSALEIINKSENPFHQISRKRPGEEDWKGIDFGTLEADARSY